jgi:hypothetical protein
MIRRAPLVRSLYETAHQVGGLAVRLLQEVRVHVEGDCGIAVTEAAGDGPDVNPGREQPSGDEMPKVVKPDAW